MICFNPGPTVPLLVLLLYIGTNAIRIIGQDVTVVAGDDAQLFCQLVETTERLTSVTWQRQTKEIKRKTDFLVIALDGTEEHVNGLRDRVKFTGDLSKLVGSILLSDVTPSDEGIYTCVFSVFPSGPSAGTIRLEVLIPPVVTVGADVPPVADDTEKILATCTAANAKPAAEVSWVLGDLNNSVKVQTNTTVDSEGKSTVISNLIGVAYKHLNQQKVQCLVTHPGLKEKLELDYTLNIHYPPQVVYIISKDIQGERSEFQCEVDANPQPTVFNWSRDFPVKESLSIGVTGSRLNIQLDPDNNGLYFCVVSNQYGVSVGSLYMRVKTFPGSRIYETLFFTLLIPLILVALVFVARKTKFPQQFQDFIESLRNSRHNPVPPDSPAPSDSNVDSI